MYKELREKDIYNEILRLKDIEEHSKKNSLNKNSVSSQDDNQSFSNENKKYSNESKRS